MHQLNLSLPARENFREEEFLVAECNRAAWQRLAQPLKEHALLLSGPAHCGKTHLAHIWAARHQAAFLQGGDMPPNLAPQSLFAATRHLVVDECEKADETALFHLLNHLRAEPGLFVLLTRDSAAADVKLPDLRSRLRALPQVVMEEPDEAMLAALLLKLFNDRQIRISKNLLAFLLPRMERSYHAARQLVEGLDAAAIVSQSPITIALARRLLQEDSARTEKKGATVKLRCQAENMG